MNRLFFRPPGFDPWLVLSRQPAVMRRELESDLSIILSDYVRRTAPGASEAKRAAAGEYWVKVGDLVRRRRLADGRGHAKGLARAYFRRVGSMDLDPSILR